MRPWLKTILPLFALTLPGCRASATTMSPAPAAGIAAEPAEAPSGGREAMIATSPEETRDPQLFVARSHPPRSRPLVAPVALSSLPRLVDRTSKCYDPPRRQRPVTKRGKSGSGGGYKHVPYGGATPPPAPSAKSGSSSSSGASNMVGSTGSTGGVLGGTLGRSEGSGSGYGRGSGSGRGDIATREPSKRERRPVAPAEESAAPSAAPSAVSWGAVDDADSSGPAIARDTDLRDPAAPISGWGEATYLSNDDSMSLSSAQRIIYAIERYLPLPRQHLRPHELLNYFSFATLPVAASDDFSVLANLAADPEQPGAFDLALAVQGRPVSRETRRHGAITLVIDRSGSMSGEGRMTYLKQGLRRMVGELKPGDLVNLVIFDHEVCTPLENFVVGRDAPKVLEKAIDRLEPRGATDLYSGLSQGYQLADRVYQPTYTNRVVLITDALTNTGITDTRAIAMVGKYYDDRRIRLSGVGVGSNFNDSLLDGLTERGRGGYVFLGSPAEVDAVFGERFVSLLETTAVDVHFRLHLPPSLRLERFSGEEASVVKEEVQAIHYFANTSQLFLSHLESRDGVLGDGIMLTVEYRDPETGEPRIEEFAWAVAEILGDHPNIAKARLLGDFVTGLGELADRASPSGYRPSAGGWRDPEALSICSKGHASLASGAERLGGDPEIRRVRELWATMCSRYDGALAQPVSGPGGSWPGATGSN